jgi:hypothetical protein
MGVGPPKVLPASVPATMGLVDVSRAPIPQPIVAAVSAMPDTHTAIFITIADFDLTAKPFESNVIKSPQNLQQCV